MGNKGKSPPCHRPGQFEPPTVFKDHGSKAEIFFLTKPVIPTRPVPIRRSELGSGVVNPPFAPVAINILPLRVLKKKEPLDTPTVAP